MAVSLKISDHQQSWGYEDGPRISLALEFKHPVYVKQIALEFFTHILFRFHRRPPEI